MRPCRPESRGGSDFSSLPIQMRVRKETQEKGQRESVLQTSTSGLGLVPAAG